MADDGLQMWRRYEESKKSYRKYLEMKPGNPVVEKELSQLQQANSALDTTINLFESDDYNKALDFTDKVVLFFSRACSQIFELGIYPVVDPLDSTSRMLSPTFWERSITESS
ncbi:hypothetical protein L6452_17126 [Arctium lappa]|uniref:Uncharacterized protein n=1 Tax=Arctium lappa TaxID=4217 RepID=A0ACB9C2I3_ARCLA|nr:hypothetical protein L6452_17126 [Arctium lappa]